MSLLGFRSKQCDCGGRKRKSFSFEPLEQRELLAVCHWTGGGADSYWSNEANWAENRAPAANDDVYFNSQGTPATTNNNITGLSLRSVTITEPGYELAGYPISVTDSIYVDLGSGAATISLDVATTSTTTLNVGENSRLWESGVLSTSGSLTKTGMGTLVLTDPNSSSPAVQAGALIRGNANLAPYVSVAGGASVNEGSSYTLQLSSTVALQTSPAPWQITNWGDGETGSADGVTATLTHTYADGTQNLLIDASVTDSNGGVATITKAVTVNNVAPQLEAFGDREINVGSYTLHLSSFDPGADTINQWTIDWKDGSQVETITGNPSFVTHTYTTPGTYNIVATAFDDDGSYTVAGNAGKLDTTFGVGGMVVFDATTVGDRDVGCAVGEQADHKIVVASVKNPSGNVIYLTRYVPNNRGTGDKTLDTTFGAAGIATIDMGSAATVSSLAIDSQDRIVVTGTVSGQAFVLRYLADGSGFDTSFNPNGKLVGNYGGKSVAVLPGDKILVGGTSTITRLNVDGSVDTTYTGVISSRSIAVQSNGKTVVASTVNSRFRLTRYNVNGTVDTSFGSGGSVTPTFGGSYEEAYCVTIQADGKILVAGITDNGANGTYDMAIARYTSAGQLDTTFGSSGKVKADFGSFDYAYGMAIQQDGCILVTGNGNNGDTALARYLPGNATVAVKRAVSTWTGNGRTPEWTDPANWAGNLVPLAGDAITFSGTTRTTSHNDFAAGTTFSSITFASSNFNLTGEGITLTNGITLNSNVSNATVSLNIALAGPVTVSVVGMENPTSTATLTLARPLSGSTGSLTKTGLGTLILSGANSFGDATPSNVTVDGGILLATSPDALPYYSSHTIVVKAGAVGGSVASTGHWTQGTIATLVSNVNWAASGTSLAIDTSNGDYPITNAIANPTGAAIGLIKLGSNTLTLSGDNSYTGGTTLVAGTLSLGNPNAIGTEGTISFNGGTLQFTDQNYQDYTSFSGVNRFSTADNQAFNIDTNGMTVTLAGVLVGTGSRLVKSGTGTLILTADNTYTGGTTISGGTLQVGNYTGTGTLGSGSVEDKGSLVFYRSGTATFGNRIWGTGTLTQAGPTTPFANNTLILTNSNNSYSGGTTIYDCAVVQLGDGVVNGSIGSGPVTSYSQGSGWLVGTDLVVNNVNATTLANTISGDTRLTQQGAGLLTLTGTNNTYTGGVTIADGRTLRLGNASATGSGTVTVNGTLNLNGISATLGGLADSGSGTRLVTSEAPGNIALTVGTNNTNTTFTGLIQNGSGTVSLTKTGTGTLTLAGNNTYHGSTTLGGGTLQLGIANALPASTAAILSDTSTATLDLNGFDLTIGSLSGGIATSSVMLGSQTLTVGDATNTTYAGTITGSGGNLVKEGSGTLTLSGTNSCWGNVTVDGGILLATTPGALPQYNSHYMIAVNTGAVGGSVASTGHWTQENIATLLSNVNWAADGTSLAIDASNGDYVYSVAITDPGADVTVGMIKLGPNTLTLNGDNSYRGGTTLVAGTLSLGSANAIGTEGTISFNGGTLQFTSQNHQDYTSFGGVNRFSTADNQAFNIDTNGMTVTLAGVLVGTGSRLVKSGTGTLIVTGDNTYDGGTIISGGVLQVGNYTSTGKLGTGSVEDNASLVFRRSDTATFDNRIWGTGTLTQAGPDFAFANNTLILTNANNSYSGGTTIYYCAILQLGDGAVDGSIGSGPVTSYNPGWLFFGDGFVGANLVVNNANDRMLGNTISGTTRLTQQGPGLLTLTGTNNTHTGGVTIADGSKLRLGNANATGPGTVTVNGTLDLNGISATLGGLADSGSGTRLVTSEAPGNIVLTAGTNNWNTTFTGLIQDGSGTLSLTKTGIGTLALAGNNTYSGGTTINSGGALQVGNDTSSGQLGTGSVQDNGSLVFFPSGTMTIANSIAGSGTLTQYGYYHNSYPCAWHAGTLILTGNNSYSGATQIYAGCTLRVADGGTIPGAVNYTSGGYNSEATLAFDYSVPVTVDNAISGNINVIQQGTGPLTLTGAISGAASVTQQGAGVLTLTGTNKSYIGRTTIANGSTLRLASANATGTGTVYVDGTLELDCTTVTLAGLSDHDAGSRIVTSGLTDAVTLNVGRSTATFSGVIQDGMGPVSLTVDGTGTQILTGANTYSGITTINRGTLEIGSGGATGSLDGGGNITVASGATLRFNRTGILNVPNRISGSGAVKKAGSGTMVLTGDNVDYQGTMTISSGTVQVGPGGTSHTLGSGGATNTVANSGSLVFNCGNDITVSTAISGGGQISKQGTDVVALAGSNTYTGWTTINGGVLSVSTIADTGSSNLSTGSVTLNGGTLRYTGSAAVTTSRTFSGSGSIDISEPAGALAINSAITGSSLFTLTKLGAGVLTLGGSSSNTNLVLDVEAGTVQLGKTNARAVYGVSNIASGATVSITGTGNDQIYGAGPTGAAGLVNLGGGTFDLGGKNENWDRLTGTGTVTNSVPSTTSILTLGENGGSSSFDGAIEDSASGVVALSKAGSGTLTLSGSNTYSGGTTIKAGTLQLGADNSLPTDTVVTFGTSSTNGVLELNGYNQQVGGLATGAGANLASQIIGNSSTLVDATLTINSLTASTFGGTIKDRVTGTGARKTTLVKNGGDTLTLSGQNTYRGGTIIEAGTLRLGANNSLPANTIVTLGTASTNGVLELNGYNQQVDGVLVDENAVAASQIVGNSSATTDATLTINSPASSTFAGTLQGRTALTKRGTGILTLAGLNTFSGLTTVNEGTLFYGADNVIGSGDVLINGSTALLSLGDYHDTVGTVTLDGGGSITSTTGTLTSTGTFEMKSGSVSAILAGTNAALNKTTTGTVTLGGNNTYSGGTTINAGTLSFAAGALGSTGNITFANNSTLQWSAGNQDDISDLLLIGNGKVATLDVGNNSVTFATGFGASGSGAITKIGAGTLILGGANTYSGGTTISAGTLQLGDGISDGSLVGDITDNAALIFANSSAQTYSGVISGSGTLTKSGAGTLTLNSANTYAGGTTINAGTLQLGDGTTNGSVTGNIANNAGLAFANASAQTFTGVISGSGMLTKNGAGTLVLTGANSYTGGTAIDAGTLQIGAGSTAGSLGTGNVSDNSSLVFNRSDAITVSSAISGTGSLTKNGTGTLVLSGNNTYSGATTVGQGELCVTGSISSSAVTVASGATLSGTGTVGAVTASGNVSPGVSGVGTLHTGNLTLNSSGTLNVDVTDSGCDLLDVAGTVTLNSGHLNVVNSRTTQLESPVVFIDDDGLTGTFLNLAEGEPVNGMYAITYQGGTGNDVALTARPPEASVQVIQAADEYGLQPGIFRVTLSCPSANAVTVNYSVTGGTAGTNYETPSGSIVVPAGSTSADIIITPIDDGTMTDNMSLTVNLTSGSGCSVVSGAGSQAASQLYDGTMYQWHVVDPASSFVTIVDGKVSIDFNPALYNVGSGATFGAYYRVPPQESYAVSVTPNLSTYALKAHASFSVSLSNTHITSGVCIPLSGQYCWGGITYGGLETTTTQAFFTASSPPISQDQPVYLNAYHSCTSLCTPVRSWGTLDPKVLLVDVDVDSNNDGTIDHATDNKIENDPSKPGKVIVTNRLDRTGNGVPDFADGIDKYSNDGANRSSNFVPVKVTLPDNIDPSQVYIKFDYSAANPALVTQNAPSGSLPEYQPGSGNFLRLWKTDGSQSREVASIDQGGDYIPKTTDTWYHASDIFTGTPRTVTLYAEGINESGLGQASINASVCFIADTAKNSATDSARTTVALLQVVYTDVSGITGSATNVTRLAPTDEPDGVATDWQDGVNDGSLLLMRVVGSEILLDMMMDQEPSGLSINFGYLYSPPGSTPTFTALPGNGFEGEYRSLCDDSFVANAQEKLQGLGIEYVGGQLGSSTHYVLAAQFYRPPYEFDMANPTDTNSWRKLSLAVDVSGVVAVKGSKPNAITLTRPPVVLVHGINSSPDVWNTGGFVGRFDTGTNSFGFRTFLVDHSGADIYNPALTAEGSTLGCGELTDMWQAIPDEIDFAKMCFQQGQVPANTGRDPSRVLFQTIGERKQRIAVQKVDIVAHSYGGLLSRWYVEQAGSLPGTEFNNRRDVRKLIELGTPNKGSPLANVVDEIFKGGVISGAKAEGWGSYEPVLSQLLHDLDQAGTLPTALDASGTQPRHFYEDAAVNSALLARLNTNPFHPDVAYASVVGTDVDMDITLPYVGIPSTINPFYAFQPLIGTNAIGDDQSLFPWLYLFDAGADATDSIVPVWSAALGVASHNRYIEVEHVQMTGNLDVQSTVRAWLNGVNPDNAAQLQAVPRGDVQRAAWTPTAPVSEQNAYEGSHVREDGSYGGAGLRRDAMIKIELNPSDTSAAYGMYTPGNLQSPAVADRSIVYGTGPNDVGAKETAITGMIQWKDRNDVILRVYASVSGVDPLLHNLGNVTMEQLHIPASMQIGVGPDDWVPFRVTDGLLGRTQMNLCGPSGTSPYADFENDQFVIYNLSLAGGGSSPAARDSAFTRVFLPAYVLPPPVYVGTSGGLINVRLDGAVQARDVGAGSQTNNVRIWDDDADWLDPIDDLLDDVAVTITHPEKVWNGLLIRYSILRSLFMDGSGFLAGPSGSSSEASTDIYQELIEPGWTSNINSAMIHLP